MDNLRSGVTQSCRYEPMIVNRTYLELARHYGLRSSRPGAGATDTKLGITDTQRGRAPWLTCGFATQGDAGYSSAPSFTRS